MKETLHAAAPATAPVLFPLDIEAFLRAEMADGAVDFRVRPSVGEDGQMKFYIHPMGKDGLTLDFCVRKNNLTTVVYQRKPKALEQEPAPS